MSTDTTNSTDLDRVEQTAAAQIARGVLPRDVVDVVKTRLLGAAGADQVTDAQLVELFVQSRERGLSLLNGQMWGVMRRERVGGVWRNVLTHQVGIAGHRLIAQRTGRYGGRASVEWCGPDGGWRDVWFDEAGTPPAAARVTVIRTDSPVPIVGVAYYTECVQTRNDGKPNDMWTRRAASQLAKCAEAEALRAAFPEELADVEWSQNDPAADALAELRAQLAAPHAATPDQVDAEVLAERWDTVKAHGIRAGFTMNAGECDVEALVEYLEAEGLPRPTASTIGNTTTGAATYEAILGKLAEHAAAPPADPAPADDQIVDGTTVEDDADAYQRARDRFAAAAPPADTDDGDA